MKKLKLLQELRNLGWFLIREGGNHEIWGNGKGDQTAVGRHPDIPEPTAKAILRKATQCPGEVKK